MVIFITGYPANPSLLSMLPFSLFELRRDKSPNKPFDSFHSLPSTKIGTGRASGHTGKRAHGRTP